MHNCITLLPTHTYTYTQTHIRTNIPISFVSSHHTKTYWYEVHMVLYLRLLKLICFLHSISLSHFLHTHKHIDIRTEENNNSSMEKCVITTFRTNKFTAQNCDYNMWALEQHYNYCHHPFGVASDNVVCVCVLYKTHTYFRLLTSSVHVNSFCYKIHVVMRNVIVEFCVWRKKASMLGACYHK